MASNTMNKNIFTALELVEENQVVEQVVEQVVDITTGSKTQDSEGFTTLKPSTRKTKEKTDNAIKPGEKPTSTPKTASISLNLSDFPALGTKITKEQERVIRDESNFKATKVDKIEPGSQIVDLRTASFDVLANKEKVATSLTCTKACRLVTEPFLNPKEGETPKFGVCTRIVCTFAHSIAELQPPICCFDGNCRFIHGKIDRETKKKIPNSKCRFRHSNESVEEWIVRSVAKRDPLPETNEHSRKPRESNDSVKPTGTKPAGTKHMPANTVVHQIKLYEPKSVKTIKVVEAVEKPVEVRKSRWDQKPSTSPEQKQVQVPILDKKPSNFKSRRHYSSSDDSSSSESESESESESDYKRKRRSPPAKIKDKTTKNISNEQVIRVPTKELAEVAIKAAFDRGHYNIRVVVE